MKINDQSPSNHLTYLQRFLPFSCEMFCTIPLGVALTFSRVDLLWYLVGSRTRSDSAPASHLPRGSTQWGNTSTRRPRPCATFTDIRHHSLESRQRLTQRFRRLFHALRACACTRSAMLCRHSTSRRKPGVAPRGFVRQRQQRTSSSCALFSKFDSHWGAPWNRGTCGTSCLFT